jgi:hypothetical protein
MPDGRISQVRFLPLVPGPFPFGGAVRPETDEYLYPRYFQHVKQVEQVSRSW